MQKGEGVQELEGGAGVDDAGVAGVASGPHERPVAEGGPQPLASGEHEVRQGADRFTQLDRDAGPALRLGVEQVADPGFDRGTHHQQDGREVLGGDRCRCSGRDHRRSPYAAPLGRPLR